MRLPEWIKTNVRVDTRNTKQLLRRHGLSTVCEEARCPNKAECFSKPTATFMILGSSCTRNCGFCNVKFSNPGPPDEKEPENIANAAEEMGLRYIVVTSVTRDDLPDGGAEHFARTITAIRKKLPDAKVEVLTPDFNGDPDALEKVLEAKPDIYNHNMETVERLYPLVRPKAVYSRSMRLLKLAGEIAPDVYTKSGIMLGLGEKYEEVIRLLAELRGVECDFITIGQYLRPAKDNLPVVEYIRPEVFEELRTEAVKMGFRHAASGPLVRSSMNAEEMYGHV
ncbi:MAG: lipoyl synthase [Nitrospirota bacterium]|nr:lipoyl synthase [Nitrospirota bacterium]